MRLPLRETRRPRLSQGIVEGVLHEQARHFLRDLHEKRLPTPCVLHDLTVEHTICLDESHHLHDSILQVPFHLALSLTLAMATVMEELPDHLLLKPPVLTAAVDILHDMRLNVSTKRMTHPIAILDLPIVRVCLIEMNDHLDESTRLDLNPGLSQEQDMMKEDTMSARRDLNVNPDLIENCVQKESPDTNEIILVLKESTLDQTGNTAAQIDQSVTMADQIIRSGEERRAHLDGSHPLLAGMQLLRRLLSLHLHLYQTSIQHVRRSYMVVTTEREFPFEVKHKIEHDRRDLHLPDERTTANIHPELTEMNGQTGDLVKSGMRQCQLLRHETRLLQLPQYASHEVDLRLT